MIVTIIGSRSAPDDILKLAVRLGLYLIQHRHTVRSGNAEGMDDTVNFAAREYLKRGGKHLSVEIFVPWYGFNSHLLCGSYKTINTGSDPLGASIAESIHPAWGRCSQGVRKLHTRNVHQVLGADCKTPSDLVVYYAPEDVFGNPRGGTATAVNLAKSRGIKTINMLHDNWLQEVFAVTEPY